MLNTRVDQLEELLELLLELLLEPKYWLRDVDCAFKEASAVSIAVNFLVSMSL